MLTQELADDFEKEYEPEEREPLVLRDDGMGGKGHYRSAVMGSLADMDVKIRELTPTDDRHAAIFWPAPVKSSTSVRAFQDSKKAPSAASWSAAEKSLPDRLCALRALEGGFSAYYEDANCFSGRPSPRRAVSERVQWAKMYGQWRRRAEIKTLSVSGAHWRSRNFRKKRIFFVLLSAG